MYKFIITNTDSLEIANKINDYLLKAKLSPCVQILSSIDSRYMWKGKIESHKEYLILIKCKNSNSEEIVKHVESVHNYETPEIIETDFKILSKKYKKWFDESSI